MTLTAEHLPASGEARQNLVMLHGWGCNRDIWRPLLAYVRRWANVTLLDIPGCAPGLASGAPEEFADLLPLILAQCPARAVVVGHSLGGQLALALARSAPQQIVGVAALATNPKFLASEDWPGMEAREFEAFQRTARISPARSLQRFQGLQASGARNPRAVLRELRTMGATPVSPELMNGLNWLQHQDQRAVLEQLEQPLLFVLADQDALVPRQLAELLEQRNLAVHRLPECGHAPQVEQPMAVDAALKTFLHDADLLAQAVEPQPELDKSAVAHSFSRAAPGYDSLAVLQQDVGRRLLTRLDREQNKPHRVLDLGCGTGYFSADLRGRFPSAGHLGVDLAEGMVGFARRHSNVQAHWLVGDAEDLPLASGSVDLVFSSLALQWCYRPRRLFTELARVLTPGGKCVFTTLGPQTLKELRAAWSAVDAHTHVNTFLSGECLQEAADGVPGLSLALETQPIVMQYEKVGELLAELKGIGAHNMNRHRQAGLTSRRALQGMLAAYEHHRQNGLLPATYEVIFGVMEKA
ncbi:MAG: hypothetical protein Hals2KO_26300 [Halioglobus sp.]